MSTTDVQALRALFSPRAALPPPFLKHVLDAHNADIAAAADFLLALPDDVLLTGDAGALGLADQAPDDAAPRAGTPHLDLGDEAQAAAVIDNVKEIVIPALRTQLAGLVFPDVCGEADRVKYSLSGLRLASIDLDAAHVQVSVEGGREVRILASEAAIAVDVGQWAYRLRFPPVRDSGSAHFAFEGVRAEVVVRVGREGGLCVGRCECLIQGGITFRANDARLSWLYNALAPMLKGAFRPSLEDTLAQAIRTGLEQQLDEWAAWAVEPA